MKKNTYSNGVLCTLYYSKKMLVLFFLGPIAKLIQILAEWQLSVFPLRMLSYLPLRVMTYLLGANVYRLLMFVDRCRQKVEETSPYYGDKGIKNGKLRAFLCVVSGEHRHSAGRWDGSPQEFRKIISQEIIPPTVYHMLGRKLFASGYIDLACEAYEDLISRYPNNLPQGDFLSLLRDCGIVHFMMGDIQKANLYWKRAGEFRRFILPSEPGNKLRIVGPSFAVAIGHVAVLDLYLKYNKLYRDESYRVIFTADLNAIPGGYLTTPLRRAGLICDSTSDLESLYNSWNSDNPATNWNSLTTAEQSSLVDEFWEYDFPDGQVLGYTHALARIQAEWERQNRAPLLTTTCDEEKARRNVLSVIGLPENAWYVCLHVREGSFHKKWNAVYPAMRDACIDSYLAAIEHITNQGGWVIRMGDPSMKKLSPMKNVIDYAHFPDKTVKTDVLICTGCRFFLGTNSGFATIPAIYGVRCVLTNWLPLGLPLWFSQDLMIPKLFRYKTTGKHLTFEQIFEHGLAFMQNSVDLPDEIELCDSSPEDILALVKEALEGEGKAETDIQSVRARERYLQIALRHGGYVGSTLSSSFIHKYGELI